MNKITCNDVIELHNEIVKNTREDKEIRDITLLDSAINSAYATFDGQELYKEDWQKIARIGGGIASNHAFINGNKRTALEVILLLCDSINLHIDVNELKELILDIASSYIDINTFIKEFKDISSLNESLTLYRTGKIDNNISFFCTDTNYYKDNSDYWGNTSNDEINTYSLDLTGLKVWEPIKELDLDVNTWSNIQGKKSTFDKYNIQYDDFDEEPDSEYGYTDTDWLAQAGQENGYDVIILKDIPSDHGSGKEYTEYALTSKALNKLKSNSINESKEEDEFFNSLNPYLYHATNKSNESSIKEHGLGYNKDGVWLADSVAECIRYIKKNYPYLKDIVVYQIEKNKIHDKNMHFPVSGWGGFVGDVWYDGVITSDKIKGLSYINLDEFDNSVKQANESSLKEKVEKHTELNPKLFKDNKLKPEVREKILEIVDLFKKGLAENDVNIGIEYVHIVGSNCSYNYHDKSDLDVHIVINEAEADNHLLSLLYSSYRSIFNKKYDIDFYGIPVELYVEDSNSQLVTNGDYDVTNDKWIKEPVQQDIPDIDEEAFEKLFTEWEDKYFKLIQGEEIESGEPLGELGETLEPKEKAKITKIEDFIKDIYDLRKSGIAKDGEYSLSNLVFKEFRDLGYLDNLRTLKAQLISRDLSLEHLNESIFHKKLSYEQALEQIDEVFGQKDVYMWSTYILPNGHCLNPDTEEGKKYFEKIGFDPEYEHIDFDSYADEIYKGDLFKDCIKMNVTYPYMFLPNTITHEQYTTIRGIIEHKEEFIYANEDIAEKIRYESESESMKAFDCDEPLLLDTAYGPKVVDLAIYSADDVVKEIQEIYRSHVVESLLKEDNNNILTLANQCLDTVMNIYPNIVDKNDIKFEINDRASQFGYCRLENYNPPKFIISLSKYLEGEGEEETKNTIYHELAHYVVDRECIDNKIIFWSNGAWKMKRSDRRGYYAPHGPRWKQVAEKIGNATNQKITRLGELDKERGLGKEIDNRAKYIVKCPNCGLEMRYQKETDFVKNPNISHYDYLMKKYGQDKFNFIFRNTTSEKIEKMKNEPHWTCGKCHKGGHFEVIRKESLEKLPNDYYHQGTVYRTDNPYEVKNYLFSVKEPVRILELKPNITGTHTIYYMCDANDMIHSDMFVNALYTGEFGDIDAFADSFNVEEDEDIVDVVTEMCTTEQICYYVWTPAGNTTEVECNSNILGSDGYEDMFTFPEGYLLAREYDGNADDFELLEVMKGEHKKFKPFEVLDKNDKVLATYELKTDADKYLYSHDNAEAVHDVEMGQRWFKQQYALRNKEGQIITYKDDIEDAKTQLSTLDFAYDVYDRLNDKVVATKEQVKESIEDIGEGVTRIDSPYEVKNYLLSHKNQATRILEVKPKLTGYKESIYLLCNADEKIHSDTLEVAAAKGDLEHVKKEIEEMDEREVTLDELVHDYILPFDDVDSVVYYVWTPKELEDPINFNSNELGSDSYYDMFTYPEGYFTVRHYNKVDEDEFTLLDIMGVSEHESAYQYIVKDMAGKMINETNVFEDAMDELYNNDDAHEIIDTINNYTIYRLRYIVYDVAGNIVKNFDNKEEAINYCKKFYKYAVSVYDTQENKPVYKNTNESLDYLELLGQVDLTKSKKSRTLYRGTGDKTLKFNNKLAGIFFGPTRKSVKGWGDVHRYKLDKDAKIYEGKSSGEYCEKNGFNKKEYKELDEIIKYYTNIPITKTEDFPHLTQEQKNELEKAVEEKAGNNFCWYDLWDWCTQLIAKIELSKQGYDGALWTQQDFGNPVQWQIWNQDKVKLVESLNESKDRYYRIEVTDGKRTEGLFTGCGKIITATINSDDVDRANTAEQLDYQLGTLEQYITLPLDIKERNVNFAFKEDFYKEWKEQLDLIDSTLNRLGYNMIIKEVEPKNIIYNDKTQVAYLKESNEIKDSAGNILTKEQINYFKNSKIRDKSGNLLVVYHGTKKPGFKVFSPSSKTSQFGPYKFNDANVNYFSSNLNVAKGYTEIGVGDLVDDKKGEYKNIYACYLNITNPYIVDDKTESDVKSWRGIKDRKVRDIQKTLAKKFIAKWQDRKMDEIKDVYDELNRDLHPFGYTLHKYDDEYEIKKDAGNGIMDAESTTYFYDMTHVLDLFDNEDQTLEQLLLDIDPDYGDEEDFIYRIDDIVKLVLMMNEQEGTNYDGIIIPDILDVGPVGSMIDSMGTDIVTLESANQIKLISNKHPSSKNEIDESILYHGTNDDIKVFDNKHVKTEPGIWLSTSKKYASEHGKNVLRCKVNTDKIYDIDKQDVFELAKKVFNKDTVSESDILNNKFRDYLKSLGYKGMKWRHDDDITYVMFDSSDVQIDESNAKLNEE